MGRRGVAEAAQVDVNDDEPAEHDEQQDMNRVHDAQTAKQVHHR